jgi:hypothetical protein
MPPAPTPSYGRVPSVGAPPAYQAPAYQPPTAPPGFPPPPGFPAARRKKAPWLLLGVLGLVLLLVLGAGVALAIWQPWSKGGDTTATDGGDAPAGATGIVRGDLDGDGKGDVRVVIADDYDSYRQITGISDGSRFKVSALAVPSSADDPAVPIDFNGDGTLDTVTYQYDDNAHDLSFQSSMTGFGLTSAIPMAFSSLDTLGDPKVEVHAGDFDGDGNADLVAWGQHARAVDVYVLRGDGKGGFAAPKKWVSIPNALVREADLLVGDFNGDGRTDLWGVLPAEKLSAKDYKSGYFYGDKGTSVFTSTGTAFTAPHVIKLAEGSDLGYVDGAVAGDITGSGHDSVVALEDDSYEKTLTVTAYDVATGAPKPETGMTLVDKAIAGRDLEGVSMSDVDGDGDGDLVYLAKNYHQSKFFGFRVIITDGNRLHPSTGWGDVPPCTGDYCALSRWSSPGEVRESDGPAGCRGDSRPVLRRAVSDGLRGQDLLRRERDDVLVARAGQLRELVQRVGVHADEHAGLVLQDALDDDLGRLLRGHPRELLVEQLGGRRLVLLVGDTGVAGDAGLDATRVDDGHADLVAGDEQLLAQRLAEAADGVLAGVVEALTRHRDEAEERGDVDDVAVAGRDQVRQELLGAVHDTPEVDADDPVHVLVVEVDDVTGERDARVVDDHVDPSELLGHRGGVRRERGPVGDVELVCAHGLGARGLGEGPGLGETGLVDVGQREVRAAAGEVQREGAADAGAGTGDDDDLVIQGLHAVTASFSWTGCTT